MFYRTTETYEPVLDGLESIRVTRTIPSLQILLSVEPLDNKSAGLVYNLKNCFLNPWIHLT